MRWVWGISIGMTLLGVILVACGALFDLEPLFKLTGLLLVVAGSVKIVIARIWQTKFAIPTDELPGGPTGSVTPAAGETAGGSR